MRRQFVRYRMKDYTNTAVPGESVTGSNRGVSVDIYRLSVMEKD